MTAIDGLLDIQITQGTVAATPTNTSLPLIVGPTAPGWTGSDVVRLYDSAASLLDDGYKTDSPEYVFAKMLTGQAIVPSSFLVAPRSGGIEATLDAVSEQNSSWYCLLLAGADDADILEAASVIETGKKLLLAESGSAAIGSATDTSSLAAQLKADNYKRTALMFSPNSAGKGITAGWAGLNLPQTPGANNWAYNSLSGIPADALTTAQRAACIGIPVSGTRGNNANVYLDVENGPITLMGTTASGQYIDITIGIDWLFFNIQAALVTVLKSGKVPYSNRGTALLISAVRSVLTQGAVNGLINSEDQPITVTAADINSVSAEQRAGRRAPTITFTCLLTGAINSVSVRGVVNI